jgi:hypothetical protein
VSFDDCRFCERGRLYRVRRRRFDLALSALGLYPYRCDVCSKRSYRFRARRPAEPSPSVLSEPPTPNSGETALMVDLFYRFVVGDASEPPRKRPE